MARRAPRGITLGVLACCALLSAGSAGCMTKRQSVAMRTGQGEAMPVIEVKPGYVERIALMDRYRLHDEMRKHMMARPRVWVEEVSPDELPPDAEIEPSDDDGAPEARHDEPAVAPTR